MIKLADLKKAIAYLESKEVKEVFLTLGDYTETLTFHTNGASKFEVKVNSDKGVTAIETNKIVI